MVVDVIVRANNAVVFGEITHEKNAVRPADLKWASVESGSRTIERWSEGMCEEERERGLVRRSVGRSVRASAKSSVRSLKFEKEIDKMMMRIAG